MCDYSLYAVKSRPAAVGDKLVTKNFGFGTHGFADRADADSNPTAVCVLPGTELAFDEPVAVAAPFLLDDYKKTEHKVARFRQVNKATKHTHHDQVEFPDGTSAMLSHLVAGQYATVLQLPAAPTTPAEAEEQTRAEYVG